MLREAIEDATEGDPASAKRIDAALSAYFQVLRRLEEMLGVGRDPATGAGARVQ
jgi:hypothetical protein